MPNNIDQINKLTQVVAKSTQDNIHEFLGAATTFNSSMYDKKIEKLQSYGTKWNKYGYNPNRNNEQFYDSITSNSEQWSRSLTGMSKLFSIGFNDSFLFGAFANSKENSDRFEQVADIYSTQRGGVTGFGQNLVLNAGYTVGIVADMVLEEAALAGITALTLGASAPVTGTAMGAKAGNAFMKISNAFGNANKLRKSIQAMNVVQDASGVSKFASKIGNFLNPLEHTAKYVQSLKKIDDVKSLSTLGKLTQGGAAAFRDVKAIQLAVSEAKLESNLLENEMYKEFFSKNPNASEDDIKTFEKNVKDAKFYALAENTIAISATNKLVFNNMYKRFDDLKGVSKYLSGNRFGRIASTGAGTSVIRSGNIFQKGFYQGVGDVFKNTFEKGVVSGLKKTGKAVVGKGGTYFTSNLGEGLQETLQETIAAKNKHQFANKEEGSYFDSLLHGLKEQASGQGLEVFLSGFLMGGVVSPITNSITKPLEWMQKGATNPFESITSPTSYRQKRDVALKQLEEDSKLINESFQNIGHVFNSMGNNLAAQSNLDDQLTSAVADNNRYDFQNKKDESYRTHLHTMMKHGMLNEFIKHVEGFRTMDPKQASEAFGLSSTLPQEKIQSLINKKVEQAKRFKNLYTEIKNQFSSPVDVSKLNPALEKDKIALAYHSLYNRAIDELIFNSAEIEQNLDRKKELMQELSLQSEANNISWHEYTKLFDEKSIVSEINNLQEEIKTLNTLTNTSEIKSELKTKKNKLDSLIKFQEVIGEHERILAKLDNFDGKATLTKEEEKKKNKLQKHLKDSGARMYKRHNSYLRTIGLNDQMQFDNITEKAFEKFYDYYKLDSRNKELNTIVEVLTNPTLLDEYISRMTKYDDLIVAGHKEYVKKSIAKFRDNEHVEEVIKELLDKGIAFDLIELDPLLEKGIMPKRFFDVNTEEEIKVTDPLYKVAEDTLLEMVDNLIERPIYEKQDDLYREAGRGAIINEDDTRTLSDLGEEFGFDSSADTSIVNTKEVLNKLIVSPFAEEQEKELARLILPLIKDDAKITFVKNASRPNTYSKEKGSVIDVRYSSSNFSNSIFTIEESILKNELEKIALEQLEDETFKKQITDLLQLTKEYVKGKEGIRSFKGLDSEVDFIKEGFANKSFQALLLQIESPVKTKSIWVTFVEAVLKSFKGLVLNEGDFDNSVFNYLTRLVSQKAEIKNLSTPEEETSSPTFPSDEVQNIQEDVEITPDTPLQDYPQELITMLIDKYLEDVKAGDVKGTDSEKLSETNLTDDFKKWVNDSGSLFIDEYNKTKDEEAVVEAPTAKLLPEQIEKLIELGYTQGEVDTFSPKKIKNILENNILSTEEVSEIDTLVNDINIEDYENNNVQENTIDSGSETTGDTVSTETIGEEIPETVREVTLSEADLEQIAEDLVENNEEVFVEIFGTQEQVEELIEDNGPKLKKLGYSKKDIAALSLKQQNEIIKDQVKKKDYLTSLSENVVDTAKPIEIALEELTTIVDKKISSIVTQEDLDALLRELLLKTDNLSLLAQAKEYALEKLANYKNFEYLKEGTIILMPSGELVKVTAVNDKKVTIVDYNNIVSNKKSLTKKQFEQPGVKVINDFNKNEVGLKTKLDSGNINELSDILRNFTQEAFSDIASKEVDLTKHFNACK